MFRSHQRTKLPLQVLVCDSDLDACTLLVQSLDRSENVMEVATADTLEMASQELRQEKYNTIFIDPLSFDLDDASEFVFGVRKRLPEIVFVLFVDKARAEENRANFYRGQRRRFEHYFTLDKQVAIASFPDELKSVLRDCQLDLSWRMSQESIEQLFAEAQRAQSRGSGVAETKLRELLERLDPSMFGKATPRPERTVFLSYRFAEEEFVSGLRRLLEGNGFEVVTGASANTYISKAILDRIRSCDFFLSLMTRAEEKPDGTFTTSPWLLEEKGAALALGKRVVLIVEEGVSDIGGLQGDWQRIHFGPNGFLNAALEAVEQLKSYVGEG